MLNKYVLKAGDFYLTDFKISDEDSDTYFINNFTCIKDVESAKKFKTIEEAEQFSNMIYICSGLIFKVDKVKVEV